MTPKGPGPRMALARAPPMLAPHASWQLPLSTMDVCVIFADVNEDDVRAHGACAPPLPVGAYTPLRHSSRAPTSSS